MTIRTLSDLAQALSAHLNNMTRFNCVNTRLIIQTGVNLKDVKPHQNLNPELVERVASTLRSMGYTFEVQP